LHLNLHKLQMTSVVEGDLYYCFKSKYRNVSCLRNILKPKTICENAWSEYHNHCWSFRPWEKYIYKVINYLHLLFLDILSDVNTEIDLVCTIH